MTNGQNHSGLARILLPVQGNFCTGPVRFLPGVRAGFRGTLLPWTRPLRCAAGTSVLRR